MRVLFLTQTSKIGASARYRVYQFLDYLEDHGVRYLVLPAISDKLLKKYHESNSLLVKLYFYVSQVIRRLFDLRLAGKFDVIFVQRDLVVHMYPFIEKILAFFNNNIIFDFDDAIYLYPPNKTPGFFKLFYDKDKISRVIKLSKRVITGNNFLKSYAERFSNNVTVIPTSIDLNLYRRGYKKGSVNDVTIIGWIGSQMTFSYLESIFPIFAELANKYKIELRVIGAKGPQIRGVKIQYRDWNLNTEIEDLYTFDIGIMPLTNDEWSRGKSATKLLQYMAAYIPAVVSPVGVNSEIIKDGINGFLADTHESWKERIEMLIRDMELRERIVNNARRDVEEFYSIQTNAPKLLEIIQSIVKDKNG